MTPVFSAEIGDAFHEFGVALRKPILVEFDVVLDAGADVNDSLSDGESALVVATANAHWEVASVLLDRGADPNASGAGWNALHQTVHSRRPNLGYTPGPVPTGNTDSIELVKKLIAKGITIDARMTKNGMKDGQHHLLPSVAFRLRNESTHDLTSVQITVQFWQDGADGELDSKPLAGISTHPLKPAAETDSFLVRSTAGYLLPDPDISALFQNSQFKDVTVRFYARRSGRLVKFAEHQLERRILPQVRSSGRP